ncbi:hypothetical protein Rs2_44674 [Raphanus sativus]|nr:hypothetical protein Rs2_44674 [Raphanus sativus]
MKNRWKEASSRLHAPNKLLVRTLDPRKLLVILPRSEQTGERIDAGLSTFLSAALVPTDLLERSPTNRLKAPTTHEPDSTGWSYLDTSPSHQICHHASSLSDPPQIEKKLEAANQAKSFDKDVWRRKRASEEMR